MNFPLSMIIIFVIGVAFGIAVHIILVSGYDGQMIVDNTGEIKTTWTLEYAGDPEEIQTKKCVKFKVCVKH